jgi:hypothetical protein
MAYLFEMGPSITDGEEKALKYLEASLPEDWAVIGNVQVISGRVSREIDAVVLGSHCAWVIDAKSFRGKVIGDEHSWVLSDGSVRERVLDNVIHAASFVKGKLSRSSSSFRTTWVESLVLLTEDDVDLSVKDGRISRHVLHLSGCEKYFSSAFLRMEHISTHQRSEMLKVLIGEIAFNRILGSAGLSGKPRTEDRAAFIFVRIDGRNGFRRVYYEDAVIDRNQLRGHDDFRGTNMSFSLRFLTNRITLVPLQMPGGGRLNGHPLQESRSTLLKHGANTLETGDATLKLTVSKLPWEAK